MRNEYSPQDEVDRTGPQFRQDLYFRARQKCIDGTDEIIRRVVPGMTEQDGQRLVREVFGTLGVNQFWHVTKFRIGLDTCKSFREAGTTGLVTEAGDVCFVDLGPVFDGHEADFGRTFVVRSQRGAPESQGKGTSPMEGERLRALVTASEEVFRETSVYWSQTGATGVQLLDFASQAARNRGFSLNPKMAGHRLGDFPHQVYAQKQSLFELQRVPSRDLWVLEIHLLDETLNRGAFYEDLLRG